MRKLLTFLIALAGIVFAVCSPASAGCMALLGVGRSNCGSVGGGGGGGGLTVDGVSTGGNSGSGTTSVATLSTTKTNDEIVVFVVSNGATDITSVVGSSLGSFTLRFSSTLSGGTGALIFEYHKRAVSALTTPETITVTFVGTLSYSQVVAFGINGANAAPYDPNASLPDGTVIGVGGTASASTTNAGSMALAAIRFNTSTATLDSGFSQIWNSNFFMVEYKPMPTAGTFTVNDPGSGGANGVILDAITP